MLLRRTLFTLLIALTAASAASAQGLVEYALILVYEGGAAGPIVDEIQMPSALEDDCRVDREVAALCDELVALEGRSLAEVMIRLDAWEGRLEQAVEIDPAVAEKLASPDCTTRAAADANHKEWVTLISVSQPIHRTRALSKSKLAILDEPMTSCVDEIQGELDRGGVPRGGTFVLAYASGAHSRRTTNTWTDHNDSDPGVAMVYTVVFGDGLSGRQP